MTDMDVYEKIRANAYEPTIVVPDAPSRPPKTALRADMTTEEFLAAKEAIASYEAALQARTEAVKQRRRAAHDLMNQFQKDLEEYEGLVGHPKAPKLFSIAWDRCHSGGLSDVAGCYSEMADLLR